MAQRAVTAGGRRPGRTASPAHFDEASPIPELDGELRRLLRPQGAGRQLPRVERVPPVVEGSKSSPSYLAHTYHTKVPPEVVEQAVRTFSLPGEVVLDPFSGSGMTGVGALAAGRRAILIDLSPSAAFLSRAHSTPVGVAAFERAVRRVTSEVSAEAAWLYRARCPSCGLGAWLEKAIWSEVVACAGCDAPIRIYEAALGDDRRIHQAFLCRGCGRRLRRGQVRRLRVELAVLETRCGGCGRSRTTPRPEDLRHIQEIEREGVPEGYWYPDDPIAWGDMWRRGYHDGIERYSDFYTIRGLRILAAIRRAVMREPDVDVRLALLFVFTNLVWHGSKMRRFNALGGARPMNGALYLPAVFEETNLLSLWRHKARMVSRHYAHISSFDRSALAVGVGSATDLALIPDESVDFVFTDPPYGGNILYSEVNALWEAWLLARTDPAEEVVVSRAQGKGVEDYRRLLTQAFRECYRVLRPGRWMTLTFNTSYAELWQALQQALLDAGFDVRFVQVLDKGHRSFKQLTSKAIAGYDIIVSSRKPSISVELRAPRPASGEEIAARVRSLRPPGELDLRSLQQLYAEVVASLLREGRLAAISIRDIAALAT